MTRVLIVEDERVLAKNVREKLITHGYEARVAHSGKEALAESAQFLPELVLLDLCLPDTDGLDILPQLKADSPFVNVIVVTAHGNERIAVDAMKAGATEYLTKPSSSTNSFSSWPESLTANRPPTTSRSLRVAKRNPAGSTGSSANPSRFVCSRRTSGGLRAATS